MAAEWREVHCATRVKLLAGLMICPTRRFRFYSGRIVALRWALAGETLARERRFPPKRDVSIKILQRQLNVDSGRPLRAGCVDEPLNWHRAEKRLLFGLRSGRRSASQGIESLEREEANGVRDILGAWNKGKLVGQKGAFKLNEIRAIGVRLSRPEARVGPLSRETLGGPLYP